MRLNDLLVIRYQSRKYLKGCLPNNCCLVGHPVKNDSSCALQYAQVVRTPGGQMKSNTNISQIIYGLGIVELGCTIIGAFWHAKLINE